ncbi:MAG: AAA family ATPase [Bacteroides sp.]
MDYDIDRITAAISAATHVNCTDEGVLIFLDEIQKAKNGITSLKYYQENAPHLHVIVAGSLLGIQLFAPKLQELLKYYYYVGGMPEAVQSFCQYRG